MKVLHCVADIYKQSGGQAYAITSLCGAIARLGHEVTLLVGNYRPLEDLVEVPGNIELVTQPASRYLKGYSPAIKSWLASNAAHADIVHTHGLWNAMSRYAVRVAAGRNKPCVLAPIGMLEPQALMRRRLTKSFFWRVVERPALSMVTCFQATSASEVDNIRRHFTEVPVCYIPNGVDLPDRTPPRPHRQKNLVFLGRVHPHKNVTLLLDAWLSAKRPPDWRLIIAGPLEGTYASQVVQRAQEHRDSIDVVGPVWENDKWTLLETAGALVLPSKSENFGMVVAEALACETPVIATTGAPWPELVERHCGWWVPPQLDSLTRAIEEVVHMNEPDAREMGHNGRILVEDRYTWGQVASDAVRVYRWLLGHGDQPACVSR